MCSAFLCNLKKQKCLYVLYVRFLKYKNVEEGNVDTGNFSRPSHP